MKLLVLLICLPVLAWGQGVDSTVLPVNKSMPDPFKASAPKAFTVTFTVTFDSLTLAEAAGYESEFRWRLPKNCVFNVTVGERAVKPNWGLIKADTTSYPWIVSPGEDSLVVGVDTGAK